MTDTQEFPHIKIVREARENYSDLEIDPENEIRDRVIKLSLIAKYLQEAAVREFGGKEMEDRVPAGVTATVAAAFQTFGSDYIHPDPFERAAILLRGVTGGHPFGDGNKRGGFLLASYYLAEEGFPEITEDVQGEMMYQLCMAISQGHAESLGSGKSEDEGLQEIADRLREIYSLGRQAV